MQLIKDMMIHDATERITTTQSTPRGQLQLASVARMLQDEMAFLPPSYIAGKTALRDAVVDRVNCSFAEAERVVDRLEANGYVRFDRRRPGGRMLASPWRIAATEGASA